MVDCDAAIRWLLRSDDPSVRFLTLTEILGRSQVEEDVEAARRQIPVGPKVRVLLMGQQSDCGFGVHPYQKWTGARWRLVSLVELAIPSGHQGAIRATHRVLDWLTGDSNRSGIKTVRGLTRRCASQEGKALGICSYLGIARDPRVMELADSLVKWQWPDGGWNCDKRPEAHHSSFAESLSTLWGLTWYERATGDGRASEAIAKASGFFLEHRLFRSHTTGEIVDPDWLKLHYPCYWHCDILQALRVLSLAGRLGDSRVEEALDLIESKQRPDGLWCAEGYYWRMASKGRLRSRRAPGSNVEVVDRGREGPNLMITLNAVRVLKAAGRTD